MYYLNENTFHILTCIAVLCGIFIGFILSIGYRDPNIRKEFTDTTKSINVDNYTDKTIVNLLEMCNKQKLKKLQEQLKDN